MRFLAEFITRSKRSRGPSLHPCYASSPELPHRGQELLQGGALGDHLARSGLEEPWLNLSVLEVGHHQDWDGGVGLVQHPNQLLGSLVWQRYVHDGGVYATLSHLLAALGHRAALGNHREVRFSVQHVGGGLAEGAMILNEQYEHDPHAFFLRAFLLCLSSLAVVSSQSSKIDLSQVGAGKHMPRPHNTLLPFSVLVINPVAGCTTGSPGPLECPTSTGPGSRPLPCA